MSENRSQRRARHRKSNKNSKIRKGAIAAGATLALGATFTPAVSNANPLGGLGDIGDILQNEMILDYVRVCQTGDEIPEIDDDTELVAVTDCSQSTGTGIGVVLPESIELGNIAEDTEIDLSDVPLVNLGERNLIELMSGLALGSNTWKSIVNGLVGVRVDPFAIGEYETYEQIQADAALPVVNPRTERYCDGGRVIFGSCVGGTWRERTVDDNLEKRTAALKMAEYLTGETYDPAVPHDLPGQPAPRGSATTIGDGIQVAAAMRGGNAVAEAQTLFGLPAIALAGADQERSSIAYSRLGIATALNMDTSDIKLTWFGQELDFTNLRDSGVTDMLDEDMDEMLDMAENLELPNLKEVSCFGVISRAEAEDLGACSNVLGTFDSYKDLREARPGESRQTQYGLTDVTSLVMGNDALVKQLTGESENTPFLDDLMHNLTSEDDRLKFAKDFVRFTKDVATDYVMVPVPGEDGEPVIDEETGEPLMERVPVMVEETEDIWVLADDDGEPALDEEGDYVLAEADDEDAIEITVLKRDDEGNIIMIPEVDENGDPVYETVTTTAAWLTSDYGLTEPVTVEWLGHAVTFFPAVEVNGDYRPNAIGLPEIKRLQEDADRGILPKVSLVQWDNAFGLGTVTLDKPGSIFRNWAETVTIHEDLAWIGRQAGLDDLFSRGGSSEEGDTPETETDDTTTQTTPADPGTEDGASDDEDSEGGTNGVSALRETAGEADTSSSTDSSTGATSGSSEAPATSTPPSSSAPSAPSLSEPTQTPRTSAPVESAPAPVAEPAPTEDPAPAPTGETEPTELVDAE